MTKKEKLKECINAYNRAGWNLHAPDMNVPEMLCAIVDALPDEEAVPYQPKDAEHCTCHDLPAGFPHNLACPCFPYTKMAKDKEPKQTPPPIGPEEARGYMDRSAIDARLCLTQNTQMISLLREIRDALVQRLEVRE